MPTTTPEDVLDAPARSRTTTAQGLETNLVLIRVHIEQQSQMLAALHQLIANQGRQHDANLSELQVKLDHLEQAVTRLTHLTEDITTKLGTHFAS